MQPSGLLSISGLASSTPFLRDFFARWRVRPFFVAREEYKNVANQFTRASASPLLLPLQQLRAAMVLPLAASAALRHFCLCRPPKDISLQHRQAGQDPASQQANDGSPELVHASQKDTHDGWCSYGRGYL